MAFTGDSWNETSPTNSDLANEIDDYMQDMKKGVRGRMANEHIWTNSQVATGEAGQHKYITLSTQTSQPGLVIGTSTQAGCIYARTTGTGVATVITNSAGYEAWLMHNSYTGGGIVPKGGIIMWSGTIATLPIGWYLCDGNNGTPNLIDKFIVGAKQDDGGTAKTNISGSLTVSGGASTVAASNHQHLVPMLGDGSGALYMGTGYGTGANFTTVTGVGGTPQAISKASTLTSSAGGETLTILNPYYALAFIMKG